MERMAPAIATTNLPITHESHQKRFSITRYSYAVDAFGGQNTPLTELS